MLVKDARQEVLEEIRKLKANIRYAQRAKKAAEKIRARVLERRERLKKQRAERLELRKQQREAALKEAEEERERRTKLRESCPTPRARTYACNADGLRLIKTYRYDYDFDYNRCVPRVSRRTASCRSEHLDLDHHLDHHDHDFQHLTRDFDGESIDDLDGLPYSSSAYHSRRYGGSHRFDHPLHYQDHLDDHHFDEHELEDREDLAGYGHAPRMHADQFTQHTEGASTRKAGTTGDDKRSQTLGEAVAEEEEQEPKHVPAADSETGDEISSAGRKSAQASEVATDDAAADSFDEGEGRKMLAVVKKSDKKALKKPAPAHQKTHGKKQSTDDAEKQAETKTDSKSKDQIEQLNSHLGAIEGKVSEITRKYEELKKADEKKDQTIRSLAEARAQVSGQKQSHSQ